MSLYHEASDFLDLSNKSGSLRSIIYSTYEKNESSNLKCNPKQVYALVSSTLSHKKILLNIISASGLQKAEKRLTKPIALLMVHDLLFTKSGRINASKGPLKEAVLRHKTRLKAELAKYKVRHKIDKIEPGDKADSTPVRWIRVNSLKCSDEIEALKEFSHLKFVKSFKEIVPGTIYKDMHVPLLFGIHPSENVISSQAYKSGKIIIQDRASCFPATILAPKPGDQLIDACAAPGNKTTHLASFIGRSDHHSERDEKISINAFERDSRRGNILKKMIHTAGADDLVNVNIQDFTTSDPYKFGDVVGMVVDPSCSGSGIFGRGFEEEENTQNSRENLALRLSKLAEFQYKILFHAMLFPNVKVVVYSTCSIHAEENEQVVKRVLNDKVVKLRGWRLRPRERVLPLWERRGLENELDKDLAQSCVRVDPIQDGGIGFFAACFERQSDISPDQRSYREASKSEEEEEEEKEEEEEEDDEWNGFID